MYTFSELKDSCWYAYWLNDLHSSVDAAMLQCHHISGCEVYLGATLKFDLKTPISVKDQFIDRVIREAGVTKDDALVLWYIFEDFKETVIRHFKTK